MFDKLARMNMYKNCKIEKIYGAEKIIEEDADDTKVIQIILQGRVKLSIYKWDVKTSLELGQLIAGEVCGDASI